jgi:hypothetical protein
MAPGVLLGPMLSFRDGGLFEMISSGIAACF